jgi:hypothetical protein
MTLPNFQCDCCEVTPCDIDITGVNDITNWTQVSGTWTDVGGIRPTSADGVLVYNTAHPTALSTMGIIFTVNVPNGGKIRVCIAYADVDNYLFYEVEVMGGACAGNVFTRLGHRTGGADTILEQFNFASMGTVKLCYNGTVFSAHARMDTDLSGTWGDQIAFIAEGITPTAGQPIFSLSSFAGIVDNFCSGCEPACQHPCREPFSADLKRTPGEVAVYLDSIVNAAGCGTCEAEFNGVTFILPAATITATPDVDCDTHKSRSCGFAIDGIGCSGGGVPDTMTFVYGYVQNWQSRLLINGGKGAIVLTADLVSAVGWCEQQLTDVVSATNDVSPTCDFTGAVVVVTPNMA